MTTIIIGAGVAGIAAASQLKDYVILDPREYIGGRVRTEWVPIEPMEQGAGWFHEVLDKGGNPLVEVAKENNVELRFDDEDVRIAGIKGPIDGAKELAAEWDKFRLGQSETTISEAADQFAKHSKHPQAREFALGFQFVGGAGLPATQIGSHYGAPQGRDMVPVHGYDCLLKVLLKDVDQRKVQLGTEVEAVRQSENGEIEVRTKHKGAPKTYKGSSVIVTVPLSVLKAESISFQPPLPSAIKEAAALGSFAKIGKVYVEFPKKFWDDFDKTLVLDEDPALVYNWAKAHKSDRHILSVLVVNDTCLAAEKEHAPKAIWEIVSKFFDAVNTSEGPVPHPIFVKSTKWSQDPFAQGAISAFEHGKHRKDAVAAFEAGAKPIYFAGEHTTMEGAACVHGAYLSGLRAAKQVSGH